MVFFIPHICTCILSSKQARKGMIWRRKVDLKSLYKFEHSPDDCAHYPSKTFISLFLLFLIINKYGLNCVSTWSKVKVNSFLFHFINIKREKNIFDFEGVNASDKRRQNQPRVACTPLYNIFILFLVHLSLPFFFFLTWSQKHFEYAVQCTV